MCDCVFLPFVRMFPSVYAVYVFFKIVYMGYIVVRHRSTLFIFRQ